MLLVAFQALRRGLRTGFDRALHEGGVITPGLRESAGRDGRQQQGCQCYGQPESNVDFHRLLLPGFSGFNCL
jgi:hypothetical protein